MTDVVDIIKSGERKLFLQWRRAADVILNYFFTDRYLARTCNLQAKAVKPGIESIVSNRRKDLKSLSTHCYDLGNLTESRHFDSSMLNLYCSFDALVSQQRLYQGAFN